VRLPAGEDETGEIARALAAGGALVDPHEPSTCLTLRPWHVAAAGGAGPAVRTAREAAGPFRRIEVEVRDTAEALEAFAAGADGLIARAADAPALRAVAPRLVVEGVADPARLREIAATGAAGLRLGLAELCAAALPVTADAALR
jgi:nicotinate-nucleotide pyrophosphorylase